MQTHGRTGLLKEVSVPRTVSYAINRPYRPLILSDQMHGRILMMNSRKKFLQNILRADLKA